MGPSRRIDRAESEGERLLIAVPLLIKNDMVGALLVEEGEKARASRQRRFVMIQEIGQQIAMAMQADQLQREMMARERLETEVDLARQIQRTFIPQSLPRKEGWELAARWETAREVGGDFYDVVELPGGRLGLFVADVSDKGMGAALFMALTRTLFRAEVAEGASPAVALQRINDLLIPDTKQGMFVTAVYGVLDLASGDFTYANAGHNPPLWIHGDGNAQELERTAIALGVMEGSEVKERTLKVHPGESLLLFTDGLTEAFSPEGKLFGEAGLMEVVHSFQSGSAEGLVEAVEASLNAFRQALPLADDLTMLAVRRI
jgi:serine phosphatase RsbU (regulator of sigma subunit)